MSTPPAIVAQTKYVLVAAGANPLPTDDTLDMHCGVMQGIARTQPPRLGGCEIDSVQTKVGWRRLPDTAVEAVVQVRVTQIDLGAGLVVVDFDNAAHRAAVSEFDMGPWIRELDMHTRVWVHRVARTRRYYFRLESTAPPLTDEACNVHCAVLQRFVVHNPPVFPGVQLSALDTKVGWNRSATGEVYLEVRLGILALHVDGAWVKANFNLAEHRELASKVDVRTWLAHQNDRARKWLKDAARRLAAE